LTTADLVWSWLPEVNRRLAVTVLAGCAARVMSPTGESRIIQTKTVIVPAQARVQVGGGDDVVSPGDVGWPPRKVIARHLDRAALVYAPVDAAAGEPA
jgi:hypothetical protein